MFEHMPEYFAVRNSRGVTTVRFDQNLSEIGPTGRATIWIADSSMRLNDFLSRTVAVWIDAGESQKNLDGVQRLCERLSELGCTRSTLLVAVGGGVVQDIVTMAAGIFMRGVEWAFIPTTTNSALDSCLGGKSAINLGSHKNALGNFHPPSSVVIITTLLETLDEEHYLGGVFEGVKICFASGPEAFDAFCDELETQNFRVTPNLVDLSLRSKKVFIEEDEFDSGVRLLLNFGHTFGHALESASDFQIPHGIAVALGMLAACKWSNAESPEIERLFRITDLMLSEREKKSVPIDWEMFEWSFARDKKNTEKEFRIIAPGSRGLTMVSILKSEEALKQLSSVMKSETERYV
jgi:3-dehydroquinate synthase